MVRGHQRCSTYSSIPYTIYLVLMNGLFVIKKSVCALEENGQAHICSQINRSDYYLTFEP